MSVFTFTVEAPSESVQRKISDGDGMLVLELPWYSTRGYEEASPGDGAVITVSDPEDGSAWIADIDDVEWSEGYTMTVLLAVR